MQKCSENSRRSSRVPWWLRALCIAALVPLVGPSCGASQQQIAEVIDDVDGTALEHREGEARVDRAFLEDAFKDLSDIRGRVRAEAWPESKEEEGWRFLERGGGYFESEEGQGPSWTFVFSSRESALPSRGILIEIPSDTPENALPMEIRLRYTPTAMRVSREAWSAIRPLLLELGSAELQWAPGGKYWIDFGQVERISLIELEVLSSKGGRQVAMGRVSLAHQGATHIGTHYQRVRLSNPVSVPEKVDDCGALCVDTAPPIPTSDDE